MSEQTVCFDGWVCVFCSHQNDFESDSDGEWAGPPPTGEELPFRCAECGKVSVVTTEVVQVRFVAEPADDQSNAINDDEDGFEDDDDDEYDESDSEEDEEDDDGDFEEDEDEFFDNPDDEDPAAGKSTPAVDTVATAGLSAPRHLIELHANNHTVTRPVETGWERTMPGRVHPACKGLHTVEDGCCGVVDPCVRCGRPRCFVEGSSSLDYLCDDCWSAVVTKGAYWPTMEAVERRQRWLNEEWAMPRWWMWTTKLADAIAEDEAECERIDQINRVIVELPVQRAFPALSETAHD